MLKSKENVCKEQRSDVFSFSQVGKITINGLKLCYGWHSTDIRKHHLNSNTTEACPEWSCYFYSLI